MCAADVQSLSIGRLKAELNELGVSHSDCVERSELVARLITARAQRTAAPPAAAPTAPPPPESAEVQRVLACAPRDHYAVLDVPHDADADALKRAYRTLALRLHPDKCPARGADEAFKRVSTAFAVLRDPRQRAAHHYWSESAPQQAGGSPAGAPGPRASSFAGDVDAEELFRAMFGSGPFDGFGGGGGGSRSGGGGGGGGGGGKSASLARADAELVRIFGPTVAGWLAVSRRLGETCIRNPHAFIAALVGLSSAVSVLEYLGVWLFAVVPACGLAVWRCPPQHRPALAMCVMSVLMSGILL
jgi:hypothetical protein